MPGNHKGGFGPLEQGTIDGGQDVTVAFGWGSREGHTLIGDGHVGSEQFYGPDGHDHFGPGDGPTSTHQSGRLQRPRRLSHQASAGAGLDTMGEACTWARTSGPLLSCWGPDRSVEPNIGHATSDTRKGNNMTSKTNPPGRLKKLLLLGAAALSLSAGAAASSTSVEAATVPNQFRCSHYTKQCVQTNGSYKHGYPCAYRMTHDYYTGRWWNESRIHQHCVHTYYVW